MHFSKIAQIKANSLLTTKGKLIPGLINCFDKTCSKLNLKIIVVVLSHCRKHDQHATLAHVFSLRNHFKLFGHIEFYLSFQGQITEQITHVAKANQVSIITHDTEKFCDNQGQEYVLQSGKTENLLCFLSKIADSYNHQKTYIITLDDDYVVYDWFNVLLLFAPWVLSQTKIANVECPKVLSSVVSDCHLVEFTKSGGNRIVIPRDWAKEILDGKRPVFSYATLCMELLSLMTNQNCTEYKIDEGVVITPDNLSTHYSFAVIKTLETAMELYTRSGGRNGRALSLYLCSRQHLLFEGYLSCFSFLLHGDQGTTLKNWISLHLGKGYALEISFLTNALFKKKFRRSRVANLITIPHAHIPKDEISNFEMGLDLFYQLEILKHKAMSYWQKPAHPLFGNSHLSNGSSYESTISNQQNFFVSRNSYRFVEKTREKPLYDNLLYPPLEDLNCFQK